VLRLVAMSTVSVFRNFFNSLLTLCFVQLFSGKSSVNPFAVYLFQYKLFIKILFSSLNTMLFVDKRCKASAVTNFWCHKLITIENKKRTVTWKILFAIDMEKNST